MVNTSATGGYLLPTKPPDAPLEGTDLENFFHDLIVGITGLDPTLVRPRWQPEPPDIPSKGTVWIAFGFFDEDSDTYPHVQQIGDQTQLQRNEIFGVLCSIYGTGAGSDAKATAKLLRDGLIIEQNRQPLFNNAMGLIEVTAPQPAPVLTKETWLYRLDMNIRIRRLILRNYDVLSLKSAPGIFVIDAQTKEIDRTFNAEENP